MNNCFVNKKLLIFHCKVSKIGKTKRRRIELRIIGTEK